MFIDWDLIYTTLGIKEFIYFISSPSIQQALFPIKMAFILFALFFLIAVIYFYINSSYLQYKFLQDTIEFISKETFGLNKVNKSWKKIKNRMASGTEADLKLAIIEADDYLYETLQDADFQGDTFEELIASAGKKTISNSEEILEAHAIRNAAVYEPDYKLDSDQAKRILSVYENTIKKIALV